MDIQVHMREQLGTSAVNAVREKGMMPVEIYGRGFQNIHGAVVLKDFIKTYTAAGETTVITLHVADEKIPALIYDVAHDPATGGIIHADLYRVRMDEKITAHVPIEFIGESPAIKAGGVLVKAVHEIEVEALPADMPHTFTADISHITEIGGSIAVKDLIVGDRAPQKDIIKVANDMVIATVIAPREEEAAPAEAPSMDDVKVETEEKKAEREKAKEGGETPAE